ncbi:hypothetical protein GCM10028778_08570 [Barrientosiimonas marina]|uniref:TIGR04086 family membrane protein n=1 Tax=Lentibacillus kimchii TaxID=1542911 RepID=A0ABW2V060_9BACI
MRQQQFAALLYGWIIVLGLILATSVILALLLEVTVLTETALSWITLAVGFISLFIGGLSAGIKGQKKGWLIGAATGGGFTLFTFLVQYIGYQQGFSLEQSLYHAGLILAALLGGSVGVNMLKSEN